MRKKAVTNELDLWRLERHVISRKMMFTIILALRNPGDSRFPWPHRKTKLHLHV